MDIERSLTVLLKCGMPCQTILDKWNTYKSLSLNLEPISLGIVFIDVYKFYSIIFDWTYIYITIL